MKNLTQTKSWHNLEQHFELMKNQSMLSMFASDRGRFDRFSIQFNEMLLDYSKNIIKDETVDLLLGLCDEAGLKERTEEMFTGSKINFTEKRAVLHTALRNQSDNPVYVDGHNVMSDIKRVLNQMKSFCSSVHTGEFKGYTGRKIKNIINIGIGGSDLGPAMVCRALKNYAAEGMSVHFASNVDSAHINQILQDADAETTLFIIASKTFTTQETIANAETARNWFLGKCGGNKEHIARHFVALSTNEKAVLEFGINPGNMFEFWDWVGGRYSLWSAIGLSIALYIGYDNFEELMTGAFEMDMHFRNEPFESNIPVILAVLGIWYNNYFGFRSHAVIAYDQNLEFLTDFLQQLDMESNGKYIDTDGQKVGYPTGPIIWGKPGTNAQHSFFQLLHLGTQVIPADFIAAISGADDTGEHRKLLISNFLAQTEALMKGKDEETVRMELTNEGKTESEISKLLPHKVFPGNRPTNSIIINTLSPRNLGSIIAMYEHKVFVQGVLWNINSFDQWGVELGKQLAKKILPELGSDENIQSHDCSTNGLINYFNQMK